MTLRKSETVLRLMVGLALGFGFVGFATQGRAAQHPTVAHIETVAQVELAQLPADQGL